MTVQNSTQPTSPHVSLEQAVDLARSGKKSDAYQMLRSVVALQPNNQAAWLWLSAMADSQAEAEAALAQAKKINPARPSLHKAEQWLVRRFSPAAATAQTPVLDEPPMREASSGQDDKPVVQKQHNLFFLANKVALGAALLAVTVGLFVLFFGLATEIDSAAANLMASAAEQDAEAQRRAELETAWSKRDWGRAVSILEELHRLEPDSMPLAAQLARAYLQQGIALRGRGFVEDALESFKQGVALTPESPGLQQEVRLATAYLAGARHYQAGQWTEAIAELEKTWTEDRSYINVRDLLYSAHFNHGLARQAAGDLNEAKDAFEAATRLRPDLSAPRRVLAEIEFALTPGTPANIPTVSIKDRLIVTGIAEQRMLVFDGDKQVFDFVISTGEPGSDTAVGDFEILNKIDVAYASSWNLDMPYWMGIYWSGPLQNGIHALPIVKHTGYKLWDGYLGQRVSYGCIILGDEDAAKLYEWTEVGTKVKIVPSLDYWLQENELAAQKTAESPQE